MRDRDVRNNIRSLLLATNAFDEVWLTTIPDMTSNASSSSCAAAIEPESTQFQPTCDSATEGSLTATSKVTITVLARSLDAQTRDELAEQLVSIVANALNGQALGNLVNPQTTNLLGCVWNKAIPPERRITTSLSYQYIINGWDSVDQSP